MTTDDSVLLHLFADTRYRLFVNNTFVAYGPGRFVTAHPEYDTHEISPHLLKGNNVIRVEVNYYGCSSFQTMPDGLPGFIAAGGSAGGATDFATPGAWLARMHKAWDSQAPLFSFAQNPIEICDTRILEDELALPATLSVVSLPAEATPWAKPEPRSSPYPDYAIVRPTRILTTGPLAESLRWGFHVQHSENKQTNGSTDRHFISYATWIHSPKHQTILLDCFWSRIELNGQPIAINYPNRLGNHGECLIELRAGWNFLSGRFEVPLDRWSYLLGLPFESGATLHSHPNLACVEAFAISCLSPVKSILSCPASPIDYTIPEGWSCVASDLSEITPARLIAWEIPATKSIVGDIPYSHLKEVATHSATSAVWAFDFGDEYYGHPVLEVEAPAGSLLDVAYDDWKRADGCVNLYQSNPFTDAADRFILKGGRQRIEVLNPRGGIFLQIVLRVPEGSPPVPLTVYDVGIRRRTTLNNCEGSFISGDEVLDWAWGTAVHTLQCSTDEAYADCPWRERGSYIGDSLVNFHLHRLITSDLSVARRTFHNFGLAQLPDGQLACCAPSWLTRPHEDFSLIWIKAVRDFWAYTGDTDFAANQWQVIQRILSSPSWKTDGSGLWNTTGLRCFIDWGVLSSEREGAGNAVINIFRIEALRATAELASALGHESDAIHYTTEAKQTATALIASLWNEKKGRFNASIGADTPAIHANILALHYGLGPSDRILSYLDPLLRANFRQGTKGPHFSGYFELYFFYYLLPALVAHSRLELAETLIREHYGFIKSLGYPTLTEYFHAAEKGNGSCCHSWSGSPAIFATEYILGLRLVTPGQPNHWMLDPVASQHHKIEGSLPHPNGLIRVHWHRQGNRIVANASLPPGVTLTPGPHVDLTLLYVHFKERA
ncbi:MAG: hypothetical protein WCH43_05270 [Verrucomicrobiota bacterium]